MFESIGADTGIDIQPLVEAGCRVSQMADYVGDSPPPSKIILDELAKRRAEIEETEGVEADLTVTQLVRSLIGLLPRYGDDSLTLSLVTERLEEAREQVSLFLEAPTNRAAVLFSLLFVRVLPTPWIDRSEIVAITLFSLAMVLLLGLLLTMIQVAGGVQFPRSLSEKERAIVREALEELAQEMDSRSTYPRSYEV